MNYIYLLSVSELYLLELKPVIVKGIPAHVISELYLLELKLLTHVMVIEDVALWIVPIGIETRRKA